MPKGVYARRPRSEVRAEIIAGKAHLSQIRHDAVMSRWESVREEREMWMLPFRKLEIERALRYLEDLRSICTEAGVILNERINAGTKIICAGPHCKNDLTGNRPNGMPKWIAKVDSKDINNPEISVNSWSSRSLCSGS